MDDKKLKCVCKKCELIFDRADAITVERKIYGVSIEEKKCPNCGWDFTIMNIPKYLDKYLNVNIDPKYYTYK